MKVPLPLLFRGFFVARAYTPLDWRGGGKVIKIFKRQTFKITRVIRFLYNGLEHINLLF